MSAEVTPPENYNARAARRLNWTVFLALAAMIFVAGYWHINTLGIYGDDWGASTYVFQPNLKDAVSSWWQAGSGEISNFRLLAVIIPVVWYGIFQLFGLVGIIAFNFLCYSALAYLAFVLLRRHVSAQAAFLGAALFALYPTNNAYLWQVTLSYVLAMICTLGAVYYFYKHKFLWASIALIAGLLINEGVFFIFALALLPPGAARFLDVKARLKVWLKIVIPIVAIYALLRVGLELKGATGGNRTIYTLEHFSLFSYVWQFIKAEGVVLVISWGAALWKIYKSFHWVLILPGLAVLAVALLAASYLKNIPDSFKPTKPQLLMLAGLLLICAGRYYGFYYIPSINVLNLDTRYYFAASVGGAVFFVGLYQYLLQKIRPVFMLGICCFALAFLGSARFSVQDDYRTAWLSARGIWREIIRVAPAVRTDGLLYVEIPGRVQGNPVGEFEAVGDLRVTLPLLGRPDASAVTSPYVTRMETTESGLCVTSPPFYNNLCIDRSKALGFIWQDGKLAPSFGDPVSDGQRLTIPENFYRLIE